MNQDQVKEKLLQLADPVEHFSVIFSGKSSLKVDGLYKPDTREILIHNKNLETPNRILYTAIHEYAHHIQFMTSPVPVSGRAHTTFFWNIFHELLKKAEAKGIYQNLFDIDTDFVQLTEKIKEGYLKVNGKLMKEFGELLLEAFHLCKKKHADFEDYVDRALGLPRATAKTLIKVSALNINPSIGYENMKTLASIQDAKQRRLAETAFIQGESPDQVKSQFLSRHRQQEEKDTKTILLEERTRVERRIFQLREKLNEINEKLREAE